MALTPSAFGRAPVPPLNISYWEYQRPDCGWRPALEIDPPAALPSDGAPALDLLADFHLTAEVRLFAS